RNDSVLYQKSPRNSAHIDAATAPSVGVKIPVVMPPIRSTGVMIGSTASNLNFQSAANSTSIAITVDTTGLSPATISAHTVSGNAITTSSSTNALPTRGHSNLMSAPQLFLCAKYATVTIII